MGTKQTLGGFSCFMKTNLLLVCKRFFPTVEGGKAVRAEVSVCFAQLVSQLSHDVSPNAQGFPSARTTALP